MKRLFVFGCSYMNFDWLTVADLIGSNFDEYYNFGEPGACNTFISDRLFETNELHKFNRDTDYVVVGITGFGRFSYYALEENVWKTTGDIMSINPGHPEKIKWFAKNMYNYKWATYRSWVAIKSIKNLLIGTGVKHTMLMSINNEHYADDKDGEILGLDPTTINKAKEIYELLDIKESIDSFLSSQVKGNYPRPMLQFNSGEYDHHPSQLEHFKFFSKYFPEFVTEKSTEWFDYFESTFNYTARIEQGVDFNRNMRPRRKESNFGLFMSI